MGLSGQGEIVNLLTWIQVGLGVVVLGFVLNVLFESNVRTLIEHHGWDTILTRAVSKVRERHTFWFAFGVVLGATAMAWILPALEPSEGRIGYVETELRLQFYGGLRDPTIVSSDNVYHWFAEHTPAIGVKFYDKNHNEIVPPNGTPVMDTTWSIFVLLDRPAAFRQILVSFSDPAGLGPTDIWPMGDRGFIIHTSQPLPAGELVIMGEK
jgi:hypothetical protein